MTVATFYPDIRPSLLLDFANVKALDPRVTFTRASSARYYDGVTVAKAEENLVIRSQEFEDTAWGVVGVTVTANTSAAPDGTTTADTLDDGAATSVHNIVQNFSGTSDITYTLSAFFKDVDRQFVILACSAGPNTWASAKFNLTAGTVGSTSAAGSGWGTISSSITNVGNSWYRCTITFVSGSTGELAVRIGMATDSTTFTSGERGLQSYTGSNKTILIWGAQLEQRATVTAYTATTTQPITNYVPQLLTAANNVARFDHDPITGESLGLLIEEQRTNLLLRSEEFNNASWTKTRSSITANVIVAPDGTLTGDKLVEDTSNNTHILVQNVSVTSGTTYTFSCYAKAAERPRIQLRAVYTSNIAVVFDLIAGTSIAVSGSPAASSITHVGNGWYRCTITGAADATQAFPFQFRIDDGAGQSYTGDGYSGIYIWGAQLEEGAFATSYIPTVSSQVTRSADSATMTGTNFSSWYRQDEGTLFLQYVQTYSQPGNKSIASIDANSQDNQMVFLTVQNPDRVLFYVNALGPLQAEVNAGAMTLGEATKQAAAYKVNSISMSVNGSVALTDTTALVPQSVLILRIGAAATGLNWNGTVAKFAYYPLRLTNTQLQALTK
jgi:hypothetical protein